MYEEEQPDSGERTLPEWTSNSMLDIWEPDKLYIEWLTFLYGIWKSVEYL